MDRIVESLSPYLLSDLIQIVFDYHPGLIYLLYSHSSPFTASSVFFDFVAEMSEFHRALYNTVWDLGFHDILAPNIFWGQSAKGSSLSLRSFAQICTPSQFSIVNEAFHSLVSDSKTTSDSSSSSSTINCLHLNESNASVLSRLSSSSIRFISHKFSNKDVKLIKLLLQALPNSQVRSVAIGCSRDTSIDMSSLFTCLSLRSIELNAFVPASTRRLPNHDVLRSVKHGDVLLWTRSSENDNYNLQSLSVFVEKSYESTFFQALSKTQIASLSVWDATETALQCLSEISSLQTLSFSLRGELSSSTLSKLLAQTSLTYLSVSHLNSGLFYVLPNILSTSKLTCLRLDR
jgi:hypothetical protein